jgi:hypothetical protein
MSWGHGAGFAIYFIALWSVTCYSLSWVSGWHALAERYRCEQDFEGERWRFRSAQMRWTTKYNGVLILSANREGLYLSIFFPFRLGHPPLFIPWSEITFGERRLWLMAGVQFVLGREERIPFWVYARLGSEILACRPAEAGAAQDVYSRPGLEKPRTFV